MTSGPPRGVFLASDTTIEDALPFLSAFRRTNPHLRLLMIPAGPAVAGLSAFGPVYGFDVLQADFAAIDLLEDICFGAQRAARGCLRLLATFDVAASAVVWLDTSARVTALDGLLARLAAQHEPAMAAQETDEAVYAPGKELPGALTAYLPFATTVVGLGGPPIGSARLIRSIRENLVTYMTCRASAAKPEPVLNIALAMLAVHRIPFGDLVVRTGDATPEVASLLHCSPDAKVLDNGGLYRRIAGHVVGAPGWMAAAYRSEAAKVAIEPPPALVARLRHATVHRRGIVITEDCSVVRESLINVDLIDAEAGAGPGTVLGTLRRRPVAHRDCAGPVVLLKQTWDHNYGHWLVESLPRISLVAECMDLAACRFLIGDDPPPIGRVYRDTLHLLGIGDHQIIASTDETRFCADLIYPAPLTVQPWVKAPRAIRFLEALAARVPPGPPGPSRIYVSRNRTGSRVLRNEAAIMPALAARGYVAVEPQLLDFAGQVRAFRDATHIVGNLGAGLTNVAFAPRGVRLLALTTEFMQDDFFWDLVSQRDGRYVSLHGRAADPAAGMQSYFDIDPDLLWPLLDELERGGEPAGPGRT